MNKTRPSSVWVTLERGATAMRMASTYAATVVVAWTLAGCGADVTESIEPDQAPDAPSASPIDGPAAADAPKAPRDESGLIAYGAQHPDTFAGMYIDPDDPRMFVMMFTVDLEEHAREVSALVPAGTRARVERARFTQAELESLLEGLDFRALDAAGHEMVGAGLSTTENVVELVVKSDDPTLELRLEAAHGGALDVVVHPKPRAWMNAAAGEGWRLLGFGQASHADAYTVRAATSEAQWVEMWDAIGLGGVRPPVEFEREVAVSFGHGIGSSCPELRLDDVVVTNALVHSVVSDPLAPRGCTADLTGAAVFVVAVSREPVGDEGFWLSLGPELVTCGEECGAVEQLYVQLP